MSRYAARSVVIVSEDEQCSSLVAAELRAMGCRVFCARDLPQAAGLVRAGLTTRFVLVRIGEGVVHPAALRAEIATHLPGWDIECDGPPDEPVPTGDRCDRLVN